MPCRTRVEFLLISIACSLVIGTCTLDETAKVKTREITTTKVTILSKFTYNIVKYLVNSAYKTVEGANCMVTIHMVIELNYVLFSFLLAIYSAWHYFKRKDRYLLYLTLCFTYLLMSNILPMFVSISWIFGIQIDSTTIWFLELGKLVLYACFTVCAVIALRKILERMHL